MGGRRTAAAAALAATLLAGCGGGAGQAAKVGDRAITREQVDRLVERAREESGAERRSFPRAGSDAYRALEREALAMLVYRAQVEVAARKLGVRVTDAEVREALGAPPPRRKEAVEVAYEHAREALGIPEEVGGESALLADATRVRLTLQKLVDRLGADEVQPWLERARRDVPVEYADGWRPQAGVE